MAILPTIRRPSLEVTLPPSRTRLGPVPVLLLALALGGLGAFPNLLQPRIVWMGVARDPRLELMQHDIELACATLGVAVEGRAFRPHLTLGRAKQTVSREAAVALRSAARATDFRSTIEVSTLDLMQSTLSPGGSRYAVLDAAPLGGH